MNIITSLPKNFSARVKDALIKEIRTGLQLAKAQEDREAIMAAAQAKAMKGHRTIKGLGRCVLNLPPDAYFRALRKYGHDEVHSKGFIRYFNKKHPELCPNKA